MAAKANYDPARQRTEECKKCRRPMVMRFNTTSGKYSPWDPPAMCGGCRPGSYVDPPHAMSFLDNRQKQATANCDGAGAIWISHFATCAFADDFRKDK